MTSNAMKRGGLFALRRKLDEQRKAGTTHPYYVVQSRHGTFDLRQERFRQQHADGNEHPHDLMATGFSRPAMVDLIAEHFAGKVDTTALD